MDTPEPQQPKERVLIVEDERPMRDALERCLVAEGYRVLAAADGEQALEMALHEQPSVIVLDVMMPRLDGFAVCREIRRRLQLVPILMLTAKGGVQDRVRGLDAGADDYLIKPFSTDELLARLRSLLRRTRFSRSADRELVLGDTRIDLEARQATQRGKAVHFTAKEYGILRLLVEHRGRPVSRELFLDVVWGYGAFPTTRTVDSHIALLRSKIEPVPEEPRFIETVHGVGYRLTLP